eukprot:8176715-Ditylum_brightwellii.AAC.1
MPNTTRAPLLTDKTNDLFANYTVTRADIGKGCTGVICPLAIFAGLKMCSGFIFPAYLERMKEKTCREQ